MMAPVKDEAKQLLEKLPEDATWDDLMYEIYVKQKVSDGQQAAVDGQGGDRTPRRASAWGRSDRRLGGAGAGRPGAPSTSRWPAIQRPTHRGWSSG